jgi:hypothetical protein
VYFIFVTDNCNQEDPIEGTNVLDQNIISVAKKRVVQDLEDRRQAFDREKGQLWETLNARGALR